MNCQSMSPKTLAKEICGYMTKESTIHDTNPQALLLSYIVQKLWNDLEDIKSKKGV